jgi:hypothetical protein
MAEELNFNRNREEDFDWIFGNEESGAKNFVW